MALPEKTAFSPTRLMEIDRKAGLAWKKSGIFFCENNGWDWLGNAFLLIVLSPSVEEGLIDPVRDWDIQALVEQLTERGINWRDFVTFHDGYLTDCFGFDDNILSFADCVGIEEENLDICAKEMEELGIRWCGWDEGGFQLVATEEQIIELRRRLEEPINRWREENG